MEEQNIFELENGEFKHMRCIDIMLRIIAHRSKEMSEKVFGIWKANKGRTARDMFILLDS